MEMTFIKQLDIRIDSPMGLKLIGQEVDEEREKYHYLRLETMTSVNLDFSMISDWWNSGKNYNKE